MPYTINIVFRARADIRNALAWLVSRSSPSAVTRWHKGLLTTIRSLTLNPDRFPLADEAADLQMELRELLYGRRRRVYRVLFTVDGPVVHIHRVRHAAQDRLTAGDI